MTQITQLKLQYEQKNQSHIFKSFDSLSKEQQTSFQEQLESIDLDQVTKYYKIGTNPTSSAGNLSPLSNQYYSQIGTCSSQEIKNWNTIGLDLIKQSKVCVLLLAGGQGTRLGSTDPKGCYNIGLKSNKSLFRLHAERITKMQLLGGGTINWFIMTSELTFSKTKHFFETNNFFGLNMNQIHFFNQGLLPCLSKDGKILLKDINNICFAPDGNGGVYKALHKHKIINKMKELGIEHVHCFSVDNCLVKVCDSLFIGYCANKSAKCGAKTVEKTTPDEQVGVICMKNNRVSVVEYTELDKADSTKVNKDGSLVFSSANICNHYYSVEFLDTLKNKINDLPCHIAYKKIECIDPESGSNETIKPTKPNAIKLEQFVFDVFGLLEPNEFVVLQGNRHEEFSPLKNSSEAKVDCPETCRKAIYEISKRFIKDAGGKIKEGVDEVELSPLLTYSGENMNFVNGKTLTKEGYYETKEQLLSNME